MDRGQEQAKVEGDALPPLMARLNATRESIARGRTFTDSSARLIAEERDAQDMAIAGEAPHNASCKTE